jgi:transposase-like protein
VSYETVRRLVAKFGAYYADELRRREVRAGRTWHLDEMAARVGGRVHWLWRAVDEHGQTLDVLLQERRDTVAAEAFFRHLLAATRGMPPERITTDKLGSYAAALTRLPTMRSVEHVQVRSARRCTNRVEPVPARPPPPHGCGVPRSHAGTRSDVARGRGTARRVISGAGMPPASSRPRSVSARST